MEIRKANKNDIGKISERMLEDLKDPPKKFPKDMIEGYRKHATKEDLVKEFDNPNLIGFVAIENESFLGFIVGYDKGNETLIDYLTGAKDMKKELLNVFIEESKSRGVKRILADSFEFMENDKFLEEEGFEIFDKEEISEGLVMLWREFVVK